MRRLAATLKRDVMLQLRYGLYAVSVFVVIVWGVLLRFLAGTVRLDAGLVVPAFLSVNLLVTTFYFMGGLVLLEKDEGMLAAAVTTPLRDAEYLLSKVLTLSALALAESLLVAVLLFGPPGTGLRWGLLLAGSALLAAFYALAGFVAVVRHDSINEWLLPSVAVVTFLLLPLVPHFGFLGRGPFYLHPVEPALALMRAAWAREPAGGGEIAYGLLGSLAWAAAALAWARRRFDRFVVRTAGG